MNKEKERHEIKKECRGKRKKKCKKKKKWEMKSWAKLCAGRMKILEGTYSDV